MESVAFSADGTVIASENESWFGLWSLEDGDAACHSSLPDGIRWLRFSHDGRELASSDDGGIRFWDASTGRQVAALPFRIGLDYGPDDRVFVSLAFDFRISVFERRTSNERLIEGFSRSGVFPVAPDEQSEDSRARELYYHASTTPPLRMLSSDGEYVLAVLSGRGGLYGSDLSGVPAVFLDSDFEGRGVFGTHAIEFWPFAESLVYVGRSGGTAPQGVLLTRTLGEEGLTEVSEFEGRLLACAPLPTRMQLAVVTSVESGDRLRIQLIDRIDGATLNSVDLDQSSQSNNIAEDPNVIASCSTDSEILAVSSGQRTTLLLLNDLSILGHLEGHPGPIQAHAFCQRSPRLATADESTILIWDLQPFTSVTPAKRMRRPQSP